MCWNLRLDSLHSFNSNYITRYYAIILNYIIKSGIAARTQHFEDYVPLNVEELSHADRVGPFPSCCRRLLLPVKRKSVAPIAAQLAFGNVRSKHQWLHHFVGDAAWSEEAVPGAVRARMLKRLRKRYPGSFVHACVPRLSPIRGVLTRQNQISCP